MGTENLIKYSQWDIKFK